MIHNENELNARIQGFLGRKKEQFPELADTGRDAYRPGRGLPGSRMAVDW